jgi:penicillin-binding protein 1A
MLRYVVTLFGLIAIAVLVVAGGTFYVFYHYGRDLPDYRQLAVYEPPVMTRVHAGDGRLLAEYAIERRVFVPIKAMPRRVVQAFLSAEDKNFYDHPGIDLLSIVRAAVVNVRNLGSQRRPVGASTITQQVAKNFLLTNEVSFERKIKEAILAFRIERAFPKDRILELYLNEIYLGYGSYGVAAAALNYFNKPLDKLMIAEAAFLAALPKAPNNYHPARYPEAAKARRDWVIGRMLEDGVLTPAEAAHAQAEAFVIRKREETEYVTADYFAEEVRRELLARYGEVQLYKGGLSVRTTLDPKLEEIATRVLRQGLETYDRRHGWRGPVTRLPTPVASIAASSAAVTPIQTSPITTVSTGPAQPASPSAETGWLSALLEIPAPPGLHDRLLAVVTGLGPNAAEILLRNGTTGRIPLETLAWARPVEKDGRLGPKPRAPADVLAIGDVIAVEPMTEDAKGQPYPAGTFALHQIPEAEGALVALDPHTGRVLAMVGGYDFKRSQFNRVTQAWRQPGSAFKPIVYLAALDSGYTPSTLILDAPFVIDQGPGLPKWRPDNYTRKFYGPSTMRLGIEKSRNLMTVRLAQTIGIDKVAEYAEKLGVVDKLPRKLSMALGAGETTLLRLTAAYAMLVNGGKRITPTFVDRIQDRHGRTVYRHDHRTCPECQATQWTNQPVPVLPDNRPAVTDPASAYQMVSMLQGVIERGTGRRVAEVSKPLAGKTGTTNDSLDAWFIGFSPDLAVGVFVGYDEPKSLGDRETGGSVAAPVFRDFMREALKDKTAIPFRIPPGIRLMRVSLASGRPVVPGERDVILEAFKPGTMPTDQGEVLEGVAGGGSVPFGGAPSTGTGGLY